MTEPWPRLSAARCNSACRRSINATRAPSARNRRAVAKPTLPAPPVTRQTLPSRRFIAARISPLRIANAFPPPLLGKIGAVQDAGISHELAGLTVEADPASLHHIGDVGDLERDVGELLDQQNSDTLLRELLKHRNETSNNHWRKAKRQLVGEQIARSRNDRLPQCQHLLLAARHRARARRQARTELRECLQGGLDGRLDLGTRQMAGGDLQIILDAEVTE